MFWFLGLLSCQSLQVPHHCLSLSCLCCFTNRAIVLDSGIAHGTVQCVALVRTIFCIDVLVLNARPQSLSWTSYAAHRTRPVESRYRFKVMVVNNWAIPTKCSGPHRWESSPPRQAHAGKGTAHPPPGKIRARPPRQAQGQREPGGDPHQGGCGPGAPPQSSGAP